ncbi:MAG: hypothetical protein IT304_01565 [Dehalococcoidia bacterium]|nr:hypothetical protein [Dehalococcoidia bacterium]
MQVLVDYYEAINSRTFDTAYRLWADNGAASNQTSRQFAEGFAQTVRSVIHFGQPTAFSAGVQVPATVLAVVNTSASTQAVQQFEGRYTVAQSGGAWRIASASLSRKPDLAEVYPATASDTGTLQAYYGAINAGELARAYSYWEGSGTSSGQSFPDFVNGFGKTVSSTLTIGEPKAGGAAGSVYSDIPVFVVAKQADGTQRGFCGTYTMRRANVPPFPLLGWGLYSASVTPYAGAIPSAAAMQTLLKNGCAS